MNPARKPGRPPVEDKRQLQRIFNRTEWTDVQRRAEAAGMSAAAWVRAKVRESSAE